MKKLKFWLMAMLAIVATISLSACGDDDEPSGKGLQGLWQNESFIYYFGSGGKGYKQHAPTNGAYEVNPPNAILTGMPLMKSFRLLMTNPTAL